jgi:hypothetical protein
MVPLRARSARWGHTSSHLVQEIVFSVCQASTRHNRRGVLIVRIAPLAKYHKTAPRVSIALWEQFQSSLQTQSRVWHVSQARFRIVLSARPVFLVSTRYKTVLSFVLNVELAHTNLTLALAIALLVVLQRSSTQPERPCARVASLDKSQSTPAFVKIVLREPEGSWMWTHKRVSPVTLEPSKISHNQPHVRPALLVLGETTPE